MSKETNIVIDTRGLTDSEALKLRVYQLKSKFRMMDIQDIYTFFKHFYKEHNNDQDKDRFQLMINTQRGDEEFTDKLEKLYHQLKTT